MNAEKETYYITNKNKIHLKKNWIFIARKTFQFIRFFAF